MAREIQTDKGLREGRGMYNPSSKRLYNLKEAAEYLGRSEWGMRDLMWKGLIPVVKPDGGRKVYFDKKDLDAFIENNKATYA